MTVKAKIDAIDSFVRDLKTRNLWDDIGTAAIMTGWTNIAGALTPLKGAAPTNNGFADSDLDAGGVGLKGNGSSKYIDSNRAGNADGQDDSHISACITQANTIAAVRYAGITDTASPSTSTMLYDDATFTGGYVSASTITDVSNRTAINFFGATRSSSSEQTVRVDGVEQTASVASVRASSLNSFVFCRNLGGAANLHTDATLSWYSIGSSLSLSDLDAAVSSLMSSLRGIAESGYDRDALSYIRRVEEADGGAFLETGVKQAINQLVVGLKSDIDANGRSAWDAIGASCLLCGPRTLAGALVPLRGDAPTAQGGWASGDYDRSSGLKGNGSTLYLDSNFASSALPDNSFAGYAYGSGWSDTATAEDMFAFGSRDTTDATSQISLRSSWKFGVRRNFFSGTGNAQLTSGLTSSGGLGGLRDGGSDVRLYQGGEAVADDTASTTVTSSSVSFFIFARNDSDTAIGFCDARLAFYSIGSALDLAALDTRVSAYVAAIAAAL